MRLHSPTPLSPNPYPAWYIPFHAICGDPPFISHTEKEQEPRDKPARIWRQTAMWRNPLLSSHKPIVITSLALVLIVSPLNTLIRRINAPLLHMAVWAGRAATGEAAP